MKNSVIRSNRINVLFQYAIRLAQDRTETESSIHGKLMAKAQTLVSRQTAIEYVNTVFARIERLRKK